MAAPPNFIQTKKMVSHTTRKYLIQKLVDDNIPPNEISKVTGHKNINLLNNYPDIGREKTTKYLGRLSWSERQEPSGRAMIPSSPKKKSSLRTQTYFRLPLVSARETRAEKKGCSRRLKKEWMKLRQHRQFSPAQMQVRFPILPVPSRNSECFH